VQREPGGALLCSKRKKTEQSSSSAPKEGKAEQRAAPGEAEQGRLQPEGRAPAWGGAAGGSQGRCGSQGRLRRPPEAAASRQRAGAGTRARAAARRLRLGSGRDGVRMTRGRARERVSLRSKAGALAGGNDAGDVCNGSEVNLDTGSGYHVRSE